MYKKNMVICIMAILLCVGGIALAKAVKLNLVPPANSVDPDGYGHAVLNYSKDEDVTIIQVNCEGLTPGHQYGVNLGDNMGSVGTAVAHKNGKIMIHAEREGDLTGNVVRVRNGTLRRPALSSK